MSDSDVAALTLRLVDERAADIVDVLNEQKPDIAARILLGIPFERAVEVLDTPGLEQMPEMILAIPRDRIAPLLSAMSADRLADLFRELPEPARPQFLALLNAEVRATLRQLLAYGDDCVGTIMTTEFVSVPTTWTAGETLQHLRMVERTRETVYAILVVDPVLRPNSAFALWVSILNSAMASMGGFRTKPASTALTLSAPSIRKLFDSGRWPSTE